MNKQASTAVKTAALIMMAPALLMPFEVAAQQMAAAPSHPACDTIKDPARSAQCHWDAEGAALKARTAAANGRIQVAERDGDCADEISRMRATNPAATDIGRELVKASGRPAADYGICRLRDGIRAGLAAKR